MSVRESYNDWSSQYDTNENKTRDLEALALRSVLGDIRFKNCLEIGCGTAKNTEWLLSRGGQITAVDFSDRMLQIAREKVRSQKVEFIEADITKNWHFIERSYDLVVFSLVLEHIEDLDLVFSKLSDVVSVGGFVYIGELHPFRQHMGSKARFSTENGERTVTCYIHNISDFIRSAKKKGLILSDLDEYFDNDRQDVIPRVISILLKKT